VLQEEDGSMLSIYKWSVRGGVEGGKG
jgi:hypothetical protein